MFKVAVTGANGFIGRHVIAELAHYPVEVIASVRDVSKLANISNVHVVEMDIAKPQEDDYVRLHKPDILIHLAWQGLPNYDSLHHFETELPIQYWFIQGLVRAGLPSLLVSGTCFEYGMQNGILSENLTPLPYTAYGYAKDALRRQLEFLCRKYPFAITWARLFYIYGEGQSKSSLLPKLKEAIARGDTIFNMSGGEQLRDYLPVKDVATILVKLALKQENVGIINVCSGKPISVRNLVESWVKDNSYDIRLNLGYYGYPSYEPVAFWGDNSKLKGTLNL